MWPWSSIFEVVAGISENKRRYMIPIGEIFPTCFLSERSEHSISMACFVFIGYSLRLLIIMFFAE